MRPHASGAGGYVNFMTEPDEDKVRAAYGVVKYERLARIPPASALRWGIVPKSRLSSLSTPPARSRKLCALDRLPCRIAIVPSQMAGVVYGATFAILLSEGQEGRHGRKEPGEVPDEG